MKKVSIKHLLLVLPAALLFSCKPALKVSSDYDRSANFSSYKTFSLYYLVTNRNVNELNEDRIWNAIRANMSKKGYIETNENPDLVVNALSTLKNKRYVTASGSAYGYGAYRPYGYWGGGYRSVSGQTTFQTNNYKEGSLAIEVVDGKTNKLIWEGAGLAEFEKQPKNPEQAISNAVNKIMADFPQGNGKSR